MSENCASCSRFVKCKNLQKSTNYICDRYKPFGKAQMDMLAMLSGTGTTSGAIQELEEAAEVDAGTELDSVLNLRAMIEDAMDPKNAIAPDLKIDDRDIKQAPNFYTFCMSPKGLNQPPLPKQFALFTHLFNEWCPNPKCTDLKLFADHRDFPTDFNMRDVPERITLLRYGVCPNCGRTKSKNIRKNRLPDPQELILVCGQRSGKSIGLSLAESYLTHWHLKSQGLANLYQQTSNTHFTNTMVALTFKRAQDLLFIPFMDILESSPWFQNYFEMLNDYGERFGEEILIKGKLMLGFKHRQLVIHPMNPSKRTLRGDTRVCSATDEFGWFPFGEGSDDREKASAGEVYEALDNSMATVRAAYDERIQSGYDNIPNAYGIWTSSPQAFNDQIMTLKRTLENSTLAVVGHYASWEFNPKMKRDSAFIRKKYLQNPIKAERDFGANPPLADTPFIENPADFLHCFTKNRNSVEASFHKNKRGSRPRRYGKLVTNNAQTGPSLMALDSGYSNNSFALTVGQLDEKERPIITGVLEIMPKPDTPLDFSLIFDEVIMPIIISHNVVRVYVDRWQSIKICQDIEKKTGSDDPETLVEGVQYSLKKQDFTYGIDIMMDQQWAPVMPKLERSYEKIIGSDVSNYPFCFENQPMSHLMFQIATVQETSRTIDKGAGYTDDIFRSLMLLLNHLYDDEVVEFLKTKAARGVARPPIGLIAGVGRSGGSIGSGAAGGAGAGQGKTAMATSSILLGKK